MTKIGRAGTVLERPDGGYIAADVDSEYDNLKDLAAILLALLGASVCVGTGRPQSDPYIELAVQATIESIPENLVATAWDAWVTRDRSLV